MKKQWYQSKTIWTGISGLVATVGAYLMGDMVLADALQAGLTCLTGIFLRTGMMGK